MDVTCIITVDHYINPQDKKVLKYGMYISPELVDDLNLFNSTVATRITAIAESSVDGVDWKN